jgi:hypothetical protein
MTDLAAAVLRAAGVSHPWLDGATAFCSARIDAVHSLKVLRANGRLD